MLLAIDPGTDTGWALFDEGRLIDCGLGDPSQEICHLWSSTDDEVVIECPRIYPGGRTRNPQDLIKLALKAGEHAGLFRNQHAPVAYVEPAGWKGRTPKTTQHKRDATKLTAEEKRTLALSLKGLAPSKKHNVRDAVGIGLWAVGRGNKKRVAE